MIEFGCTSTAPTVPTAEYFGKEHNHGTTVHTAIEEELIDPETSIRIGDRGGLYGPDEVDLIEDSGVEYYTTEEVNFPRTSRSWEATA